MFSSLLRGIIWISPLIQCTALKFCSHQDSNSTITTGTLVFTNLASATTDLDYIHSHQHCLWRFVAQSIESSSNLENWNVCLRWYNHQIEQSCSISMTGLGTGSEVSVWWESKTDLRLFFLCYKSLNSCGWSPQSTVYRNNTILMLSTKAYYPRVNVRQQGRMNEVYTLKHSLHRCELLFLETTVLF